MERQREKQVARQLKVRQKAIQAEEKEQRRLESEYKERDWECARERELARQRAQEEREVLARDALTAWQLGTVAWEGQRAKAKAKAKAEGKAQWQGEGNGVRGLWRDRLPEVLALHEVRVAEERKVWVKGLLEREDNVRVASTERFEFGGVRWVVSWSGMTRIRSRSPWL